MIYFKRTPSGLRTGHCHSNMCARIVTTHIGSL